MQMARDVLRNWQVTVNERDGALETDEHIGPDALAIGDYESGRPRLGGV